jgi:hypothetical protein
MPIKRVWRSKITCAQHTHTALWVYLSATSCAKGNVNVSGAPPDVNSGTAMPPSDSALVTATGLLADELNGMAHVKKIRQNEPTACAGTRHAMSVLVIAVQLVNCSVGSTHDGFGCANASGCITIRSAN